MTKEEAKQKYKNGEIQICVDINKNPLLREISEQNLTGLSSFYKKIRNGYSGMSKAFHDLPIVKLSEIEEEVVWLGSDMQVMYEDGTWRDFNIGSQKTKYRLKPNPDYTAEIEALQSKAKENGMKAVITFEKL